MATGGCDRSVDSGVTCSICLEPYRGRQPKLLPCSHTFCLPCLTQIADKERKRLRQMRSEEEEVDVSITCPTCRSPVTLPPTGVAGLLTNVYLDTSKVKAVREEKEANEEDGSGSDSQIEMMEAFLKKMKKKRSSQQKLTKVQTGVKDESSQHGQSTKSLESKVDLLTNLVTSLQNQVTGLQNQNTMLCRDQTSLHEKHDREMTSLKAASKKDRDVVTSLEHEVAELRDKNAILCQDKEQLRNDVTNLQSDVTRVRDYVNTLQVELDKLQGQQGAVQSDIAALRAERGLSSTPAKPTVQRSSKGAIGFQSADPNGSSVILENTSSGGRAKTQNMKGWKLMKEVNGKLLAEIPLDKELKPGQTLVLFAKGSKSVATADNEIICDFFSWGTWDGTYKLVDDQGQQKANMTMKQYIT